jgi:hypothetical protein
MCLLRSEKNIYLVPYKNHLESQEETTYADGSKPYTFGELFQIGGTLW